MSCRLGGWSGLAVVAGRLCSSAVWSRWTLHPSVPQVCWFAEIPEPVQSAVLLLFSSSSHPEFVQGPPWQKSFCWYGFVCLTAPWAVSLKGPSTVRVRPHGSAWGSRLSLMEMGWSLGLEGRAASCQPGSTLWKNSLGSWKWLRDVWSQLVWAVVVAPC